MYLEVYDRAGATVLGELDKAVNITRNHMVSKSGTLTFDMYVLDPKTSPYYLDHGHIVVLWSEDTLPWCGYITTLTWAGDLLTVGCVSIEQRLGKRQITPTVIAAKPAYEHFHYLLTSANRREHTGIYLNTLYTGGANYTIEHASGRVYDAIQDLLALSSLNYSVDLLNPLPNGTDRTPLVWSISLVEKLGTDRTGEVSLIVGLDTADAPSYEEDSTNIATYLTTVGSAPDDPNHTGQYTPEEDWSRRPKGIWQAEPTIRDKYGLAEDTVDENDVTTPATLLQLRTTEGNKRLNFALPPTITINKKRHLWNQFWLGDVIVLELPYVRFTGIRLPFRVLGIEIHEDTDSMTLAGEVVTGDEAKTLTMYKGFNYGVQG